MNQEQRQFTPPMSGAEALAMFGDKSLLALEQRSLELENELKILAKQIGVTEEDGERELLQNRIQFLRAEKRRLDRDIRGSRVEFGKKRGPLTYN